MDTTPKAIERPDERSDGRSDGRIDGRSDEPPIGILLLNLGGPPDLAAVEPFLYNLFSDREIIQLPGGLWGQRLLARIIAKARSPKVRGYYQSIGGGSPILPLTRRQAEALERRLNDEAAATAGGRRRFQVRPAMRYWHPRTEETLAEMHAAGIRRVVAVTLYPQYSAATTGSSLAELRRAAQRLGWDAGPEAMRFTAVERYAEDSGYLDAVTQTVAEALAAVPGEDRAGAVLLFSAHGLPIRFIERGDPYEREIHLSRDGVLRRLRARGIENEWRLAYQSRTGPVKWLGPPTEEVIGELARGGARAIVIIPIAFVSDHIETLYEIDQLFAGEARAAGIRHFVRTRMLTDDPLYISTLARLVRAHLDEEPV